MRLRWTRRAREDYERWRRTDTTVWKHINALIRDAQQNPYEGLGRPRALQFDWAGWWTREITKEHRLIYRVRDGALEIARCRDHYSR